MLDGRAQRYGVPPSATLGWDEEPLLFLVSAILDIDVAYLAHRYEEDEFEKQRGGPAPIPDRETFNKMKADNEAARIHFGVPNG